MRFADIIGQEELKRRLAESADAGRVSHALLFSGAAGTEALAVAVAYVQYLNCRCRRDGDSCGECPDCRQIAALEHPDLHLLFPVNRQGKKSGEPVRCDDFLPQFRQLFAERRGCFAPAEWYDRLDLGRTLRAVIAAREADALIGKLAYKAFEARYNGLPTAGLGIKLASGANALNVASLVKAKMQELSQYFPEGLTYDFPYDSTLFVRVSIHEVIKTLAEAIVLVFIVMAATR